MTHEHDHLVEEVPLLARLRKEDLQALASRGTVRNYRTGTVIFHEGAKGDSLHIIVEGAVRISMLSARGEEATLAILGPGECIGDLSMLDGRPRSASAIATQPAKTLIVTREHFRSWLLERPRAALVLLETLAMRVRRTDEALADMAFLDLPHRLVKRLVELTHNHPEVHASTRASVKLKVTQSELASMLGVSRESVNKQLNSLAKNGSISLGRGSITVKDTKALQAAL
jgi:CRP/FNR family transcriptional regulator/CRP/FNR family cyclic AMP-dependent transcriptional regulator